MDKKELDEYGERWKILMNEQKQLEKMGAIETEKKWLQEEYPQYNIEITPSKNMEVTIIARFKDELKKYYEITDDIKVIAKPIDKAIKILTERIIDRRENQKIYFRKKYKSI